jgi:hypothetical protein
MGLGEGSFSKKKKRDVAHGRLGSAAAQAKKLQAGQHI